VSVVDAHIHLWDPACRRYGFMQAAGLDPLRRPVGIDDLRAAIAGTPVERAVLVEAARTTEETREMLATAAASGGLIVGVVGWVGLAGDAGAEIAELRAAPGGERLVGVRHPAEDEPDPEWLMRADVRRGLGAIAAAGLTFDLLVRPPQLEAAVRVVHAVPELRFVLDHGGKPPVASGILDHWRAQVDELARVPNVVCKLSGLVTEADWKHWTSDDVLFAADHLLESFGPARLMFGSDWPVCTLAAGYQDVLNLAGVCADGLAPAEREAVMGGVATEAYGLVG
jgi:L-fuconolactonase